MAGTVTPGLGLYSVQLYSPALQKEKKKFPKTQKL